METARLISEKNAVSTIDLMNLRSAAYAGGREAIVKRARDRLSKSPQNGVNDLFVAHGNLGQAATGKYLDEGEVLVITPRGNGQFNLLGTLTAEKLRTYVNE
jgi:hypothetical protein